MSTRSTVEIAKSFHLYTDFLDPYDGPHGYLCVERGLVKEVRVEQSRDGLIVTIRLPEEIFPILRADIAKKLRRGARPLSPRQILGGLKLLRGPFQRKNSQEDAPAKSEPRARTRS